MKDHLTTAFRDDGQLAEACKVLCEHASLPGMWVAASGPTARAEEVLVKGRHGLSLGQYVTVLAAWELWDEDRLTEQSGVLRLRDILSVLTGKYLLRLSTLLVAMAGGPASVDAWLTKNRLPFPK
jgi:hypothetical protein